MEQNKLKELIEQYDLRGASDDQQILIMLLKEIQQLSGGAIPSYALGEIAARYQMKLPILRALINRIPSLRSEDAPHSLEICGTCKESRLLADYIEKTYQIKSGGSSKTGGFSYRITGCMKNCKQGPSIRWDGTLVSRANRERIDQLINTGTLPESTDKSN